MKTKLEVGKEYWLGEAKKYKGIYKGNFGDAHYFEPTTWIPTYRDEQELAPFIKDANGFIEFPLRGVFEVESWQFTTPIAMKCTEEQFNGIKDKLVEMGYIPSFTTFMSDNRYLCTTYGEDSKIVSDFSWLTVATDGIHRTVFKSFSPDLFLALTAMTDKKDGIKGEWWMSGLTGKLIMQSESSFSHPILRKATAQEIIEHFEKKEFVLPERWCVKFGDLDTNEIILKWRRENTKYKYDSGSIRYINFDGFFTEEPLYPEITFDQFKKYVLKGTTQSCQIIPIPPTKQATLFDDRVEITDWKPKEGEIVWVVTNEIGSLIYKDVEYNGSLLYAFLFRNGFIKRTESEAKQLVEKLKQAML